MNIRIIIDYEITKVFKQYELIKNIFPKHELIVYYKKTNIIYEKYKYNIYIDVVSENYYFSYPADNHILIVNDEYINNDFLNKYLRRESYNKNPFIPLSSIINYYFCLTNYSYNILKKLINNNNQILLLQGMVNPIINRNIKLNKDIYIYFEIDIYSIQYNINILTVWTKYFLNRPEKLIIKYKYLNERIISKFIDISHLKILSNQIYYYKNIIVYNDNIYTNNFIDNIKLSIINCSYYSLIIKLYENIINNRYIITLKNDISKEVLDNSNILLDTFDENNIYKALTKYFSLNDNIKKECIKNNYNNLNKNSKKTIKKINDLL